MNVCVCCHGNKFYKAKNNTQFVLVQGTYVPNMNFIGPQIADLDMIHDPRPMIHDP